MKQSSKGWYYRRWKVIMEIIDMILDRLFVPSNCLQGEEFSAYLLWPKDRIVKINIEVPEAFEILRIHNATDVNAREHNAVEISKFEENGYLGIVLKASRLPEYARDEELLFKIMDSQGKSQIEKRSVHLFRPSLKILSVPDRISIRKDGKGTKCSLEDRILVSNEGEGMAVVNLKTSEDSELEISFPEEAEEFARSFWEDFSSSLERIKYERPEHTPLIDKLILLAESPSKVPNEKIREWADELEDAFLNDEDFAEDFSASLVVAYRKNLHIIPEVESFVTYLKSMEPNRVMIRNAIGVISVKKEPKTLKGEIGIMDFGYNTYEPVPVKFKLMAHEECDIPIHKIFAMIDDDRVPT